MVIFSRDVLWKIFTNSPLDVEIQVDKTLTHEQYTFTDPSFLDDVVLVAGVDGT